MNILAILAIPADEFGDRASEVASGTSGDAPSFRIGKLGKRLFHIRQHERVFQAGNPAHLTEAAAEKKGRSARQESHNLREDN